MDNTIELLDETGRETHFEFLDLINYGGNEYVVLLPIDDCEEESEVIILRFESVDEDVEEECYSGVEDNAIQNAVFEIFKERFKDDFNFVED